MWSPDTVPIFPHCWPASQARHGLSSEPHEKLKFSQYNSNVSLLWTSKTMIGDCFLLFFFSKEIGMKRGTFEFLNFIGTPLAEPTGDWFFHKLLYNCLPHLPCGGNDTYFCGDFLESLFITSILSLWKISIIGQAGLSRPHSWTPESGSPSFFLTCAQAGAAHKASPPASLTA